jgi:hypothetical protein
VIPLFPGGTEIQLVMSADHDLSCAVSVVTAVYMPGGMVAEDRMTKANISLN